MFDPTRLQRLLASDGFALSFVSGDGRFWYARPALEAGLYERIKVDCLGRRGETASAGVEVSVAYGGVMARGLSEWRFLHEVCAPGESSVSVKDPEEATLWALKLSQAAPHAARQLSWEIGPALLERTHDARAAVERYMQRCPGDWRAWHRQLLESATQEQIREAERIVRTPPTIQIWNGHDLFLTIVLALILHSSDVEGRQIAPTGVEPWPRWDETWDRWALSWRIVLMADRLLPQYPRTMPNTLSGDGKAET